MTASTALDKILNRRDKHDTDIRKLAKEFREKVRNITDNGAESYYAKKRNGDYTGD